MSLVLGNVDLHRACFAPMMVEIESSLELAESKAVTAIANGSGYVDCTVSGIGIFEAYDRVTLAGGTSDYAYMNGTWNIIGLATNTVALDIPYQAATTGTKPTITRANTGVKEKVVVKVSGTTVATFYVYNTFIVDGYFASVDIAPYLQGYFTSIFTLTPGHYDDTSGHVITYQCSVYPMHLRANGTYYTGTKVDLQTSGAVKNLKAHRTTEYRPCDLGGTNNKILTDLKTQYYYPGDPVMIMGLVSNEGTCYVKTSETHPPDSSQQTIADYYMYSVLDTTSATRTFTVKIANVLSGGDPITWDTELITFIPDPHCTAYPLTLYFLNRYGGFDIYKFKQINSDKFTVDKWKNKTQQNVTATKREKRLIGRPETYANMQILSDLISSPEVYDSTGARVYIKSSEMVLKNGEDIVYPEITIEIFENKFING